jgi:hypothetical protein
METTTDPKLDRLRAILAEMGSVIVGDSGGVDSAFVLAVAHQVLGERAIGMTAVSPSLAPDERDASLAVAKQIGAKHVLVESQEIEDENYQANNVDRCFFCKSELYRISEAKSREWGIPHVVNGTNLDDLGDYRPGLEAAKERARSGTSRPRRASRAASHSARASPASASRRLGPWRATFTRSDCAKCACGGTSWARRKAQNQAQSRGSKWRVTSSSSLSISATPSCRLARNMASRT